MSRNLSTFYSLLITQTLSLIGSDMTSLAFAIWIFTDTGATTPLILVLFFSFLPRVVGATFAGVLADRYDRRYVMAFADTGQALGTIFLLISYLSGTFQLWHLYAVVVLQSTFAIFQVPAFQASITMLIPDEHRNRANSIQLVTSPLAKIIAPALVGVLYVPLGLGGIIALDMLSFVVGVVVVLLIRIPKPPQSEISQQARASIWQESMAGLRFVWARKPLLMIFVFASIVNFVLSGIFALDVPYLLSRTQSEAMMGFLLGVFNLGMLAGTLLMATWGGFKQRVHTMMPAVALMGLGLVFLGTQSNPVTLGLALFMMAFFLPMNNASMLSILQIKVPPDMQGRVFAAVTQISIILIPLSYLLTAFVVDRVLEPAAKSHAWGFNWLVGSGAGAGIGLLMVIAGFITIVVSLGIYALPIVRHLERTLTDYSAA